MKIFTDLERSKLKARSDAQEKLLVLRAALSSISSEQNTINNEINSKLLRYNVLKERAEQYQAEIETLEKVL